MAVKRIIILLSIFLLPVISEAACPGSGATRTAAGCSAAQIQECLDVSEVTTINLPSESCNWTLSDHVDITKFVSIIGSGTTITANVTGDEASGGAMFSLSVTSDADGIVRISGITFAGGTTSLASGIIQGGVFGTTGAVVIDNNTFSHVLGRIMQTGGNNRGLFYKNVFHASGGIRIHAGSDSAGVDSWDEAWTHNTVLGSIDAWYFEGNTWNEVLPTDGAVDCEYGGKYVLRYNDWIVTNADTSTNTLGFGHGMDSVYRSCANIEAYSNLFTATRTGAYNYHFSPILYRGGTGIVANNSLVGWWVNNGIEILHHRSMLDSYYTAAGNCISSGSWNGRSCRGGSVNASCVADGGTCSYANCDGSNPVDGNAPVTAAIYGDTGSGTHSAADGATLTDATKAWTVDLLIGRQVYNLSDSGAKCTITDNTANTVTCTLAGGLRDHWHSGDTYKVTDGYPCKDGLGYGGNQVQNPLYQWGNVYSGQPTGYEVWNGGSVGWVLDYSTTGFSSQHVVVNRDYYNTTHPTWSPYTCPHPRATELAGKGCTTSVAGTAGYASDPTLTSITISSDGVTWTFVYNEAVTATSTADLCNDFTIAMTTTGVTSPLLYSSGDGTTTIVCAGAPAALQSDTIANGGVDYTPGTIKDIVGNALELFTDKAITNNSEQVVGENKTLTVVSSSVGATVSAWPSCSSPCSLVTNSNMTLTIGNLSGYNCSGACTYNGTTYNPCYFPVTATATVTPVCWATAVKPSIGGSSGMGGF